MKKVLIVDGFSLFFRSFYATARWDGTNLIVMKNKDGIATNAVRVFATLMDNLITTKNPDQMIVVFDSQVKSWRHDHDFYKANRKKSPEELKQQIPLVKELLDNMGIFNIEIEKLEADDVIGIIAKSEINKENEVEIVTGDYDFLQLVDNNITVTITKTGISDTISFGVEEVKEKYGGLTPDQLIDMKAFVGDASDNIPGIKGIGPKTAIKLIQEYKSLENVYNNTDKLSDGIKKKIDQNKEMGILSKKLVTIMVNEHINIDYNETIIKEYKDTLKDFLMDLELYSIMDKLGI